ncbi:uncharacterized protein G2W53_023384 [Senna tora]|uniref:Uncharacterized protein n=1 Tax=Senna tora TaxID=362788 RepID=A0A834TA23_9FABA|nr:uncharacterized protein G2W53_023384 [Senna tora]
MQSMLFQWKIHGRPHVISLRQNSLSLPNLSKSLATTAMSFWRRRRTSMLLSMAVVLSVPCLALWQRRSDLLSIRLSPFLITSVVL